MRPDTHSAELRVEVRFICVHGCVSLNTYGLMGSDEDSVRKYVSPYVGITAVNVNVNE